MRRRTLERRQQSQVATPPATTPPATSIVVTDSSGPIPTVSFPAVPSGTSELPSTVTKTLDVNLVDEVIFPPQNLLAEQLR